MSIDIFIELLGPKTVMPKYLKLFQDLSLRKDFMFNRGDQEIRVLEFNSPCIELLDFLRLINNRLLEDDTGSEVKKVIWFIDFDSAQGNGELTKEEVHFLSKIDAAFCWTMCRVEE